MMIPKKMKRRKWHRMRRQRERRPATKNALLAFGAFGLKATTGGEVTERQIEAARKAITHATKRLGKTWIRIFPHKPLTKKGAEVPMGSGKGSPENFVASVRPGTIIFEMDGVDPGTAKHAMKLAGTKLPVRSKFVTYDF